MYQAGRGVPQDDAEAVRWLSLAATPGYTEVKRNTLARTQGHAVAQFNLGFAYQNGRGVPQDAAEAVRWYRLAADQGHADAQHNLGKMYENGLGIHVPGPSTLMRTITQLLQRLRGYSRWRATATSRIPQDYIVEAHKWFNLAATQSSGDDRERYVRFREAVADRMTLEQIAEAQRRAREWTPTPEP